jgi:superfamily II DNA/RNA helicase
VYRQLTGRKLPVAMISSDLEQAEREQVMLDFRNRKTDVLIATDVLSRGIDIDGIDMVINYDVPRDAEDYVHRIGRTARAERLGTALTFISNFDLIRFKKIEKLIGKSIERLPLPFPEKEPLPSTSPSQGQRNRGEGNRPPQKKGQWRHKKRKSKTGGSAPAP